MKTGWLVSLLLVDVAVVWVLAAWLERYRIDRQEKPTFWRVMSENWRVTSPEYYNEEGRRRLPWLWLALLISFGTLALLARSET
jgi:hypothetical protein